MKRRFLAILELDDAELPLKSRRLVSVIPAEMVLESVEGALKDSLASTLLSVQSVEDVTRAAVKL